MAKTPLDTTHAAMAAAPDDDASRLRFFERVADAELFVLLERAPDGDRIVPETFDLADGTFLLAFDREERLTRFTGRAAPYAALPGRALAGMLSGQGIGLGLNLDVAPSSILIPPDALDWLAGILRRRPDRLDARPIEIAAPAGLPQALFGALDTKLATAAGLARAAYLAAVTYAPARRGHLLAFVDAAPGAADALAGAVAEALVFSGLDAGELDVAFFDAADPMAARLARTGLRFDLPAAATETGPAAPGTNPARPPKLR